MITSTENFKGKRIVVTGATGFIGSHLSRHLREQGADVIDMYQEHPERSDNPKKFYCDIKSEKSVRDFVDACFSLFYGNSVDLVIHLAAITQVVEAENFPDIAYRTNVYGTSVILTEFLKTFPDVSFIVASTNKVYGRVRKESVETDNLYGTLQVYEESKGLMEESLSAFITQGVRIFVTRCGNVYGKGDYNYQRLIPGIIRSMENKATFEFRSNGLCKRDFVYISDVVSAYENLAGCLLSGAYPIRTLQSRYTDIVYNVSSGVGIRALDLFYAIGEYFPEREKMFVLLGAPDEIPSQVLDSSKLRAEFGWDSISLKRGLAEMFHGE